MREHAMADIETPHELVLVTRFDATAEDVWAAWTEPERFAQWWAAPNWAVSGVVLDVKPGGRFQDTQTSPEGDMVIPFRGFYREVVKPERLVFTLTDSEMPDEDARTVLSIRLRAVDGGTEQEFRQTGIITEEHYDGLKTGTEMFFGRLRDYLAR
jgi:uncharacterized protein YndB with AHSA1/START domain